MGYVRSGNKDHGRQNRIEGRLEKGQKVVVVEDLISTAGSCIEVVEALREAGAEVLGVASIFTYGSKRAWTGWPPRMSSTTPSPTSMPSARRPLRRGRSSRRTLSG